jgi:hypothetical protein
MGRFRDIVINRARYRDRRRTYDTNTSAVPDQSWTGGGRGGGAFNGIRRSAADAICVNARTETVEVSATNKRCMDAPQQNDWIPYYS